MKKHEANFARVTEESLATCMQNRSRAWAACVLKQESLGQETECE
jgi:hypothetical protein